MIRFYFTATQIGNKTQQPCCVALSMPSYLRFMSMFMQ